MLLAVGEDGGTDQLTILYVGRGVDHWKSFTDSTMTFHLCYLPVGGVDDRSLVRRQPGGSPVNDNLKV